MNIASTFGQTDTFYAIQVFKFSQKVRVTKSNLGKEVEISRL